MARTKESRGVPPFSLRSPKTPYPILGKLFGGAVKGFKNLLPGSGGNSGGDEVNLKDQIAEIHEVVTSAKNEAEGGIDGTQTLAKAAEDTALTKKVDSSMKHTMQTKSGLDDNTEHKYHTHHPNSPKHPDNQTKWKIDGKEVSYDEFSKGNHGMGTGGK